jgi:hypothetical protein
VFNPTRDQARQFLIDAWAKRRNACPATPMETLAADLIDLHPEYHALLEAEDALTREWTPEQGETNPFLHLSLHLAIEEQLSIDQPPGHTGRLQAAAKPPGRPPRRPACRARMPGRNALARPAQQTAARWRGLYRLRAPQGRIEAGAGVALPARNSVARAGNGATGRLWDTLLLQP